MKHNFASTRFDRSDRKKLRSTTAAKRGEIVALGSLKKKSNQVNVYNYEQVSSFITQRQRCRWGGEGRNTQQYPLNNFGGNTVTLDSTSLLHPSPSASLDQRLRSLRKYGPSGIVRHSTVCSGNCREVTAPAAANFRFYGTSHHRHRQPRPRLPTAMLCRAPSRREEYSAGRTAVMLGGGEGGVKVTHHQLMMTVIILWL